MAVILKRKIKLRARLTGWYRSLLCRYNHHNWYVKKTVVGHYIGGRLYLKCYWCGKEDWQRESLS